MMQTAIPGSSTIVQAGDQVSTDLAGEVVILGLKSGGYYGLNSVGARIWSLIQEPRRLADIRRAILEEYEVDGDRCERDLQELLQQLTAEGLIEITDDATA
jgi:hypothetical protein